MMIIFLKECRSADRLNYGAVSRGLFRQMCFAYSVSVKTCHRQGLAMKISAEEDHGFRISVSCFCRQKVQGKKPEVMLASFRD